MRKLIGIALVAGLASAASGQVVTSFVGGSNFGVFYGGSTGDVVGFRFTADAAATVTSLGVIKDQSDGVLDSAHMVGLWRNSDMALLASVSVDATGNLIDEFYYEAVTPVNLDAGRSYTLGAMYTDTDNDSYISSPNSMGLSGISSTHGVFPSATSLGFVFPESNSTNLARLGPNMITRPIPAPASLALLGLGGLIATRRRR